MRATPDTSGVARFPERINAPMDNPGFVIKFTARAVRAYALVMNPDLPTTQRNFHKGRYEGYLQTIAESLGITVADVRRMVASSQ